MSYNESEIKLEDVINYISMSNDKQELQRIFTKAEMQMKKFDRFEDKLKEELIDAGYIVDEE